MSQLLLVCSLMLLAPAGPGQGGSPEASNRAVERRPLHSQQVEATDRQPGARMRPGPRTARPAPRNQAGTRPRPKKRTPHTGPVSKTLALVNLSAQVSREQVRWVLNLYAVLSKVLPETVSVIDDFDFRALLAGDRPDWSLEQAKTLLSRAKVSYATLKIEQALADLEAAREILLRRVPVDQAEGLLAQVWAYLVMCYNSLGQPDSARRQAENLAMVSPSGRPLPAALWQRYRVEPQPKRAGRRRRRGRNRSSRVELFVPPQARVYVNFRPIDKAGTEPPVRARPRPSGARTHSVTVEGRKPAGPAGAQDEGADRGPQEQRYSIQLTRAAYLAVEAPGKQHYFRLIEPTTKTIHVVLTPAVPDKQAALRRWVDSLRSRQPTKEQLQALAKKVKASVLVLVQGTSGGGTAISLVDPFRSSAPIWSKTFESEKPGSNTWPTIAERDVASIAKVLAPPKPRPSPAALARTARAAARKVVEKKKVPLQKPKKKPLWKKWYFWVSLGAVAVAATVFAVTKDRQGDKVDVRVVRP